MDSDTSSFILSTANLHSMYYRSDADQETAIDLGLSLTTIRPQPRHQGSNLTVDHNEETRAQKREKWTYVKVNMDGVIVGRKICILYHGGYSSLALQLEDMFGSKSISGLRLFEAESEFLLYYKDTEEKWRSVGDVSWNEFVECVKRLRITYRGT